MSFKVHLPGFGACSQSRRPLNTELKIKAIDESNWPANDFVWWHPKQPAGPDFTGVAPGNHPAGFFTKSPCWVFFNVASLPCLLIYQCFNIVILTLQSHSHFHLGQLLFINLANNSITYICIIYRSFTNFKSGVANMFKKLLKGHSPHHFLMRLHWAR